MADPTIADQAGAADGGDSILPMTLVQAEYPTQAEADALTHLYQTAAQSEWVSRIGQAPNVPHQTDLDMAIRFGQQGRWTRGLLVQAAVMEMLGLNEATIRKMNPLQIAAMLVHSFAAYVGGARLLPLGGDPLHEPELYLKVWAHVQDLGEQHGSDRSGNDTLAGCGGGDTSFKHHVHPSEGMAAKRHMPDEYGAGYSMAGQRDHFMPPGAISGVAHENDAVGAANVLAAGNAACGMYGGAPSQAPLPRRQKRQPSSDGLAYEGDHSRRDGSPPPRPPRLSTTSTETPCQAQLERWNTLERLQSVYHKPINDAATALGMGVTVLKKQCRDRGITRWPYRKLSSLDKLIASVEAVLKDDAHDEASRDAWQSLHDLRDRICDDPSEDLNDWAKKLRQANFKQQYKMRNSHSMNGGFFFNTKVPPVERMRSVSQEDRSPMQ